MTTTMLHSTELTVQQCCNCYVTFALPKSWDDSLRESQRTFYCPAGHAQAYNGKTTEQKLREQLAEAERFRKNAADRTDRAETRARAAQDQAAAAERSLRSQKGWNTRLRNRIANGVCPCCNRSFTDVRRHMAGQHPEFAIPKGI